MKILHKLPCGPLREEMADDQQSAGELRRRYQAGGTDKDDQLSASQLRARHGVQGGTPGGGGDGLNPAIIIGAIVVVVVIVVVGMKMSGNS